MESRVSRSLNRSTRETWSVCERASVRTMKSKSAAVNRARQFALIIGTSSCATKGRMASQIVTACMRYRNRHLCLEVSSARQAGRLIIFRCHKSSFSLVQVLLSLTFWICDTPGRAHGQFRALEDGKLDLGFVGLDEPIARHG